MNKILKSVKKIEDSLDIWEWCTDPEFSKSIRKSLKSIRESQRIIDKKTKPTKVKKKKPE